MNGEQKMSLALGSGVFSRIASLLKPKDPLKREILYSINTVDRILRSLETTKKNLENVAEEHKKRMKISEGDADLSRILEEEYKNIQGYLSLMNKTMYDLMKVKYRLETLFYVEEPLSVLPEVLEELRGLEPVVEKINPQLISQIKMLEQRVASLLAMSSMTSPSQLSPAMSTSTHSALSKPSGIPTTTSKLPESQSEALRKETASRQSQPMKQEQALPMRERVIQPEALQVAISAHSSTPRRIEVPIHVIEQWILMELRQTAGILDIPSFERKYGVPREKILEALHSLESKNLVRIKRKQ